MTSTEVFAFVLKRLNAITVHKTVIDDLCFRLHYAWTSPVLFILILVSLLYRLLDPISCMASSRELSEKTLNAYCMMQNTFVLPETVAKNIGEEIAHQGIDNHLPGKPKSYQNYYQWVPILLLVQSVLFYLTHYFWEKKEKNITANLLVDLDQHIIKIKQGDELMSDQDMEARVARVARFLKTFSGQYRFYLVWYVILTVANLANVCLQIYFTDRFLNASFFEHGWKMIGLLSADYGNRTDPMVVIFPRLAKCSFHQFGAAGSVETHDILCVLPFNFFYEMVFVYNLVWFTILAVLSFLAVLFWIANCASWRVRVRSLAVWTTSADVSKLKDIMRKLDAGDWFLLRLLAVNMSANHFSRLVEELHEERNESFEPLIRSTAKQSIE